MALVLFSLAVIFSIFANSCKSLLLIVVDDD